MAVMLEKYEICCGMFHGFDWSKLVTGTPQERLALLPAAQEHILAQDDGKARLLEAVTRAVAGLRPGRAARAGAGDPRRRGLLPGGASGPGQGHRRTGSATAEELDHAIRQIVSKAVVSDEVIDIFAAAGLKKPDISILSDEFLAEVQEHAAANLAVELLRKLLNDEIKAQSAARTCPGALVRRDAGAAIRRYQNRASKPPRSSRN